MTHSLVWRLILKDWYLSRTTLAIIAVVGVLSVGSLYLRNGLASLLGMLAALFATIFLGILMPTQTIVHERKRQNLAFMMSLPISVRQYTSSKILGNLAAFLILWLPIVIGMIGTVASAGTFGGLIPLMTVAALVPFVGFAVFVAGAIITESETWSMTIMAACNVSYSFVWLFIARAPGVLKDLGSPVAVWRQPMPSIVAAEIALIVLALGLTFYFQSKKTDFI
jgi:ABC-type transport system involved in multi-copper enzyme maturation permease subunit